MNITVTPEVAVLIEQKVSNGQYPSASVMIETALRLLEERDRACSQLRAEIMIGIEQAERGEVRDGKEFFRQMRSQLDDECEMSA